MIFFDIFFLCTHVFLKLISTPLPWFIFRIYNEPSIKITSTFISNIRNLKIKSLYIMIEDLFELEQFCDKFDIEMDEIIKDMYETLCQDDKFSALTEIKVYLNLSYRIDYSYNTYNYYYNNYGLNDKFYFYIHVLDHTTFLPIYRININDDIENETYTISVYQIKKVGNYSLIPGLVADKTDKNNIKETIQSLFKSLTHND